MAYVYPYLHEADIFVLPSHWEGMPITLIDAMATGLPIVATNVGGIPDMLKNNATAILVDVNEHQVAEAIMKLALDMNLRKTLGCAARMKARDFSVHEMKDRYIHVYRSIIIRE